ncbi:MAG: helix-turn-helix domain-containing protein [Clostridia bacterium]
MLGKLLAKIREDKKLSKAQLADMADIDSGHLSHIEKGDRTPSHKALRKLCDSLDIPYQPIMLVYDKKVSKSQLDYNIISKICYDKIIAVNNIDSLIDCPSNMKNATFAIRISDNSMEPVLPSGSYAFVELNTPLDNKDIGLFEYNNKYFIRQFVIRKDCIILRALKEGFDDIRINNNENFFILGKILNNGI